MRPKRFLLPFLLFFCSPAFAQSFSLHGKITNTRMEPLAFASIQVRDWKQGAVSKEDGSFELSLEEGRYELVVSMLGYRAQVFTIIIRRSDYLLNVIMEEEEAGKMSEVVIRGRQRDRSEEILRQVIRNKENMETASGAYSFEAYIKATQEDSIGRKDSHTSLPDTGKQFQAALDRMAMAEIVLQVDRKGQQIREERTGITKRGNVQSLFFLSLTEGDFNFYNNLVRVPGISSVPFLSPVSYSGLLAYRFKLLKTEWKDHRKVYTISVKPGKLSNATVEGEITVADSIWVILHTRLRFPKYHLPEYDFFEVEQEYGLVQERAWMVTRQVFTYFSKRNKAKRSGQTIAVYRHFQLNREFDKKHFGTEVSATSQEAYEKDSSFWISKRSQPLSQKELRFIRYKDSIFRATHEKSYLDSLDRKINQITWKKILFLGQNFNNHEKERNWYLPPLPAIYQPFQLGGHRLQASFFYNKRYPSRKNLSLYTNLSYGVRNKDVNGSIRLSRMYNPYNRGFYRISVGREFQYIFQGDAWINMLKRSNIFLNNALGLGHGLELSNGLFLYTDLDLAFRKSVSGYKTNARVDSLFGDFLDNNRAVDFPSYNAVYGKLRLQYTPRQKFIREPREKIILGSAWPTVYALWRKGLPGILQSQVDFDYLEFGMEQEIKLGLLGISTYSLRSGSFLSRKDLRLVDYKFQRRGDPYLFMNPSEAFQALDSTFPVFHRFYQGHYVHEFNGALINKVPLLKKLGLREIGGAGFLIAPERKLRYVEAFAGIERVFKWPFNPDTKFKLGFYAVGSAANRFRNPVMLKIGVTSWDKIRNKWY